MTEKEEFKTEKGNEEVDENVKEESQEQENNAIKEDIIKPTITFDGRIFKVEFDIFQENKLSNCLGILEESKIFINNIFMKVALENNKRKEEVERIRREILSKNNTKNFVANK